MSDPQVTLTTQQVVHAYHQRSMHHPQRYAAGPDTLDWSAQPDPFRHFTDAPRVALPFTAHRHTTTFAELHPPYAIAASPIQLDTLAAMLELSFAISAWKSSPPDLWAVRCNPSSGNLHPTEAWVIARHIPGLQDGVYHYLSRDHVLELRCLFAPSTVTTPQLAIGLSSIMWREAWKYGERAFRYCQLDTGHALGALRYAAAVLGWTTHMQTSCSHHELAHVLGLDRADDNSMHTTEPL